jgi:hypothetical protein
MNRAFVNWNTYSKWLPMCYYWCEIVLLNSCTSKVTMTEINLLLEFSTIGQRLMSLRDESYPSILNLHSSVNFWNPQAIWVHPDIECGSFMTLKFPSSCVPYCFPQLEKNYVLKGTQNKNLSASHSRDSIFFLLKKILKERGVETLPRQLSRISNLQKDLVWWEKRLWETNSALDFIEVHSQDISWQVSQRDLVWW